MLFVPGRFNILPLGMVKKPLNLRVQPHRENKTAAPPPSLDGHAFGEVAGLVGVVAAENGAVVGK
jgi:hypothetical protein